jgi:hypothetical protein
MRSIGGALIGCLGNGYIGIGLDRQPADQKIIFKREIRTSFSAAGAARNIEQASLDDCPAECRLLDRHS